MSTGSSLKPGRPSPGKPWPRAGWLLAVLLSGPAWAGSAAYSYDALGRLISVTYSDGAQITYTYDDAGNRTATYVNPSAN